ncbi:MAG: hypothetical protein GXZ07_06400 [Firmicutes bacterium]|nr:hypothetical protein [Bacillota bacterium]
MKKGAITFLDVLGWKGVWQRREDSTSDLRAIIKCTENLRDKTLEEECVKNKKNVFKGLETQVISISDTIALVTYGDSNITIQFHAAISLFIICESISKGLPVRGAICYGDYNFDDNIMAGPAVDEVASWYEEVDWIGVIYTPSALYRTKLDSYITTNLVVNYNPYIKGYGCFNTLCVKWPYIWNKNKTRDDLIGVFTDMKPITPDIGFKLANTLDFYDKITSQER